MLSLVGCVVLLFFFFKQKTAYEMRISDWSSDVCSSDLLLAAHRVGDHGVHRHDRIDGGERVGARGQRVGRIDRRIDLCIEAREQARRDLPARRKAAKGDARRVRSEEHTSELQSLMRISYAVFCLKKKNNTNHTTDDPHTHS